MRSTSKVLWAVAEGALGVTLVALVWSLAGAPDWALWVLLVGSAVAASSWLAGAARDERRWVSHPSLWLAVCGALIPAVQLVPLPPSLLALVSPRAAELREFVVVPLGLDGWRAISLDPPSTARSLARALGVLGVVFVALQLGRGDAARRRLFVVLVLCGLSVVVSGFGHLVAGESRELFGVYRFLSDPPLLTPFGNRNHLAGFLGLASTTALGLAVAERRRELALGWGAAALAMGVGVFMTFSRGGIGAYVVSLVAVGAVLLGRKTRGVRGAAPWVIISVTVAFAASLAFDQLAERAESVGNSAALQNSKLELWPTFAGAAAAFSTAGMGRGTFELGFVRFQTTHLDFTFTHPENLVLQWWAEGGWVALLALLVVAGWVTRRAWRALRDSTVELVAFIGLAGLVLHDLVDFSLELTGPLVAAALVLGLTSSIDESSPKCTTRWRAVAASLCVAAMAVTAAWYGLPRHDVAEARLAAAITSDASDVQRVALEAIDRHPADWYLFSLMANREAARGNPQNALAWVNRLLFLRPADARAHASAALALLRLGRRPQALLEFRSSFELGDPSALGPALRVAAKDDAFGRLLVGRRGWLTEAHAWLLAAKAPNDARRLLATAVAEPPNEEVWLEALLLSADVEARGDRPARAFELLAQLPERERQTARADLIRSYALWKTNNAEEAVKVLEARLVQEPDHTDVAFQAVEILMSMNRLAHARQVLERVRPFVTAHQSRLALTLSEAHLWELEERWGKALELVQTASRTEPERADLHYWLATLFERLGARAAAVEELKHGQRVDTPEGAARQQARLEKLNAIPLPEVPPQ